jgi:hypothetical protein
LLPAPFDEPPLPPLLAAGAPIPAVAWPALAAVPALFACAGVLMMLPALPALGALDCLPSAPAASVRPETVELSLPQAASQINAQAGAIRARWRENKMRSSGDQ